MSDLRPVAIPVAVLGLFSGGLATLARFMPLVLERPPSNIGVAVGAVNAIGFLLSPVAVALVGYAAGRRVDVSDAYARIAGVFGIVGGVAAFVGVAGVMLAAADDLLTVGFGLLVPLFTVSVGTGVAFAITGLAAAAVAQFRKQ